MGLFEGKTPTERNKIIAAALLGVVALFSLYFAFGRSFFGGSTTTATAKSSPTPKAGISLTVNRADAVLPTASEQDFIYQTTAVVYPGTISAPDPGRNIFAFYEPPAPCRENCPPSPIPSPPTPKPPTPLPPPPILLASFSPQTVYAGARSFRLELSGDKFTPDSRIYFNQSELPTIYINSQRLAADIAASNISTEGARQIIVQTPDGKLYSNQMILSVQAPPRPSVLYIGMIGRKRYNNDTAVLKDNEKAPEYTARLNDIVNGRFRLIDIAPEQVIFEDTGLGFKHRVPISRGILQGSMPPGRGTDPSAPGIPTFNPNMPMPSDIPGIPNTMRQYNPNISDEERKKLKEQMQQKQDVDDEGND